jgi:hypothetical protein
MHVFSVYTGNPWVNDRVGRAFRTSHTAFHCCSKFGSSSSPQFFQIMIHGSDWNCTQCGYHNYANRVICRECRQPPDGTAGASAATPRTPGAASSSDGVIQENRIGEWICGACYNTTRIQFVCNKCSMPKTSASGDWTCNSCDYHNYGGRTVCNKCGQPGKCTDFAFGARKALQRHNTWELKTTAS